MPFNPGSFTGTQNAGPKPKIVLGDAGYMATNGSFASWNTVAPSSTPFTVTEGDSAVAVFHFVDPTLGGLVELMDTATINIKWAGASSADVTGPLQYLLYKPGISGWNTAAWANVNSDGNILLQDASDVNPLVGTGVHAIAFRLAVNKDTIAENGEHVQFQLTQSSATKFTDSFYVEAKVNIVDFVNPVTSVGTSGTVTTNSNIQEVFEITGTVWNGSSYNFGTIGSGFGAGDKLKVDIAGTSSPGLSMVNFGDLTGVGITAENLLINGLRALNGLDCNQGGLYMMGVAGSTYIIFDSTNNGQLDTDGSGTDDVFVKLVGTNPHSLQSTHFDLV